MLRVVALITVAGCWTGSAPAPEAPAPSEPTPASRPPAHLEIGYARTACMGACPVFELTIDRDGRVEWIGQRHVAVVGTQHGQLGRGDLADLDRAIMKARFFERDEYGHFPVKPVCVTNGSTTSCSFSSSVFCSDTSHTIISVRRNGKRHRIQDLHCSDDDDPALAALEKLIIERTHVGEWIGDRP